MPSKEYRQRKLVEQVAKRSISTQSEIARCQAEEAGIHVTQATVSRDVNELRLVRLPAGNGLHHYRATPLAAQEDVLGELAQRFRMFVRGVDRGGNIIVIRTDEGHASGEIGRAHV